MVTQNRRQTAWSWKTTWAIVGCVAASSVTVLGQPPGTNDANRWEPKILTFEQIDRDHPPQPGGNLFIGSSSIVRWKVEESFSDVPVVNRGFGGSQLPHVLHHMDRLVPQHKPAVVVLYCGDNDLVRGRTPEQVVEDYKTFVGKVRTSSPDSKIVWIAIKPSGSRWHNREAIQKANALVKAAQSEQKNVVYIDVWEPMLGEDGTPRKELFVADQLHLSSEGYKLWTELVGPHLVIERQPPKPAE
jgi:lysophospholipase L1-like esterase